MDASIEHLVSIFDRVSNGTVEVWHDGFIYVAEWYAGSQVRFMNVNRRDPVTNKRFPVDASAFRQIITRLSQQPKVLDAGDYLRGPVKLGKSWPSPDEIERDRRYDEFVGLGSFVSFAVEAESSEHEGSYACFSDPRNAVLWKTAL